MFERFKNDSSVIGLSHWVVPCGKMRNIGEEQTWNRKSRFCFGHIGLSFLLQIQAELARGGWGYVSGVQERGGAWIINLESFLSRWGWKLWPDYITNGVNVNGEEKEPECWALAPANIQRLEERGDPEECDRPWKHIRDMFQEEWSDCLDIRVRDSDLSN